MPFGTDCGGAFKETPALCVTHEMGEAGGEALAVMGLSPERPAAVCLALSPLPNIATSAPPTPPRTRCQLCTPLSLYAAPLPHASIICSQATFIPPLPNCSSQYVCHGKSCIKYSWFVTFHQTCLRSARNTLSRCPRASCKVVKYDSFLLL